MKPKVNLILEIKNLKTYFYLDEGVLKAIDGINLEIERKKILGVVGESGCGKSVTAQSILQIIPDPGKIVEGEIFLQKKIDGTNNYQTIDITKLDPYGEEIRKIRGKEISMIFQEPMTSLSPVHTIGFQINEAIMLHQNLNKSEANDLTLDMLNQVGIPKPSQRSKAYPYQLSGGMRQRAMIAMALSCNPSLLIADEPTTALDVTVQNQILHLMKNLQEKIGSSILFITHNLGIIAQMCDNVAVIYLGKVVEYGKVDQIFDNPSHPYTKALLNSIPKSNTKKTKLEVIKGTVPIPINIPIGCPFQPRCNQPMDVCNENPPVVDVEPGHIVRCFQHI